MARFSGMGNWVKKNPALPKKTMETSLTEVKNGITFASQF
jgi:hypothetical protein